jgi:hypothetical protein
LKRGVRVSDGLITTRLERDREIADAAKKMAGL